MPAVRMHSPPMHVLLLDSEILQYAALPVLQSPEDIQERPGTFKGWSHMLLISNYHWNNIICLSCLLVVCVHSLCMCYWAVKSRNVLHSTGTATTRRYSGTLWCDHRMFEYVSYIMFLSMHHHMLVMLVVSMHAPRSFGFATRGSVILQYATLNRYCNHQKILRNALLWS
jgi:hypothetical protein